MPLARDLHPEFGYVGFAPRLCRKLGLVLAFIVFGLVAGASGVAVFMADPDPDPMHAMALAPAEALVSLPSSIPAAPAATKGDAAFAQKTPKAGEIKPPCRENSTEHLGGDCTPGRAQKTRAVQAVNERPAIAAVAIGHRDGSAVLPSEPAIPVVATPQTPEGSAMPADAADAAPAVAESPAPAASPKKSRARGNQVQRRYRDEYSPRHSGYYQGGYARVW